MTPRDLAIKEYVRRQNILAFTEQLRGEMDGTKRKLIEALLLEQEALAPTLGPAPFNL